MAEKPRTQKRHPLERGPLPPQPAEKAGAGEPAGQQLMLHIRTVRPRVTYALIAINAAVFLIRALSPQIDIEFLVRGANNPGAVLDGGEYYRLFTAMFLHASIFDRFGDYALQGSMHLIFNMYALYAIGRSVEGFFGHRRFAAIYFLGGLGGSVLSAVLSRADTFSVGASGAVFAIIGAEAVYLHHHRRLFGARGRARLQALVVWGGITLFIGVLTNAGVGTVRIDNLGHIGGLVGGAALAWFLSPFFILKAYPERPGAVLAEDVNPFERRYAVVFAYALALALILLVASFLHGG